jgi:alanine racemase
MIDALEARAASSVTSAASPRRARVHLKVDTGMGRWGVPLADAAEHLERLLELDGVDMEGVMTHFATADQSEDDGFFEQQLERFTSFADVARERVPNVLVHAANSAATLRDARAHFDAVRCGVATFGLDPQQRDAARHGLEPVLSVRSHVADIRALAPGESTGYERGFVADDDVLVAVVPIGYADGVRRSLGRGTGRAVVRGVACPIIGNVSMDHVSLLVDADVQRGDVVTLLGVDGDEAVTAEDHARWASTINYEITCGMADEPRLLRVHAGS